MIDEQVQSPSRGERMILPQHLQDMAASASKITIISDNAKPPPLSPWSPLFREERGLPPLGGVGSKNSSSDGSRRKSESRWDSMPQPKRLSDDSLAPFPSLALLRQCGYLQGQDIGYGIPMPDDDDQDGPCSPSSSNNTDSENINNNHNNEEKPERGLNLPRRRESFEVSRDFTHTDSVSLLSQVLSAFDLSDEEDDEDGDNFTFPPPPPPPPPGRFSSPTQPMQALRDSRPALSPEQTEKQVGSDTLSIPVRRASIDSVDFLLSEEDLEGFFTDEDDTEHADLADELEDSDEEEDEEEETEFYDGDDSSCTDEDEDEDSFHNHHKDDSTLVSATTATTSTTLSTLRSTDARDVPSRR